MISGFTKGRKYSVVKNPPHYIRLYKWVKVFFNQDYQKDEILTCEYVDDTFLKDGIVGVSFGGSLIIIPLIDFDCFDYYNETFQEEEMEL